MSNTATIAAPAGVTDPDANNSATDDDAAVIPAVFFDAVTHAAEDETVDVPVRLATAGRSLGSVAFSIDYDASCLDPDVDDDGNIDSYTVNATNVPADFTVTVTFDALDTDGEIDVSIADVDPPVATLINGDLLRVHYAVTCPAIPVTPVDAAMAFSLDPSATFGDAASQDVTGAQVDGVVRVWPGPRGDCNGGDSLGSADLTAIGEEIFDADTDDWFDAPNFYPGSPVGCDANASTKIRAADVTCANELYFGGDCGAIVEPLRSPSGPPELGISLAAGERVVWIRAGLTSNGHAVGSFAFSLDLDPALFPLAAVDADGDGRPDHLRFPNGKPGLARVAFDAGDEDGELDVLLAALRRSPLAEGFLVEVGVPVPAVPAGGLRLSATPAPSFGTVTGADVDGRTSVEGTVLFVDGFESGDTSAWSQAVP